MLRLWWRESATSERQPLATPLGSSVEAIEGVVLSSALGHAVEAGFLRVSPVVQLPKKGRPKQPGSLARR